MIYPGATWNPGVNAGYVAGRNRGQLCICHYTVGYNSTPIGLRGYFQFLVSRDGTVQQFAEADALCWHAGEWNVYGPGIEVEYRDEETIFTDAAREACGGLVRWLNRELGIPLVYVDSPEHRHSMSDQTGFMSHRSLVQSDPHTDYWPQADWDAMTGEGDMKLDDVIPGAVRPWDGQPLTVADALSAAFNVAMMSLSGVNPNPGGGDPAPPKPGPLGDGWDAAKKVIVGGSAPGGGVTEDDVRRVVREELDKSRLTG